jgi:hypothetical protein
MIRLIGPTQREHAKAMIDAAPTGHVVTIRAPHRSLDQNAKLWAMLTDVAMAEPDGRRHSPETWKALFMHALGHQARFLQGLDGEVFPIGFRSSKLSVREMADLISFIDAWGTQNGVKWREVRQWA